MSQQPQDASFDIRIYQLLERLGLSITPHSNPNLGYGYIWQGHDWIGPFGSKENALHAAFTNALIAIQAYSSKAPLFGAQKGDIWQWDGKKWDRLYYRNGQIWHYTGNHKESEGYEVLGGESYQETHTLYESSQVKGGFALDHPEGATLKRGETILLKVGAYWLLGEVSDTDAVTYSFIPDGGSFEDRMQLRPGMRIQDRSFFNITESER